MNNFYDQTIYNKEEAELLKKVRAEKKQQEPTYMEALQILRDLIDRVDSENEDFVALDTLESTIKDLRSQLAQVNWGGVTPLKDH